MLAPLIAGRHRLRVVDRGLRLCALSDSVITQKELRSKYKGNTKHVDSYYRMTRRANRGQGKVEIKEDSADILP